MMSAMLEGNDGGVSLSKLIALVAFMTPMVCWVAVGVGIAAFGWEWSTYAEWFYVGGGMAGGGVTMHGIQRATWKPPSDY